VGSLIHDLPRSGFPLHGVDPSCHGVAVAPFVLSELLVFSNGLRYKLRMMGIELDGLTRVYVDNEAVANCSVPSTTSSKKHYSICYHRVRECIASGMVRVGRIDGKNNLADLFTKHLSYDRRCTLLEDMIIVEQLKDPDHMLSICRVNVQRDRKRKIDCRG